MNYEPVNINFYLVISVVIFIFVLLMVLTFGFGLRPDEERAIKINDTVNDSFLNITPEENYSLNLFTGNLTRENVTYVILDMTHCKQVSSDYNQIKFRCEGVGF